MQIIEWSQEEIPVFGEGHTGPAIQRHFNLTRMHGETEFLRHGFFVHIESSEAPAIVTRTLNANRARAISSEDGSTLWVSPEVAPPPDESVQISDIAVGDLDDDGTLEVVLASYAGDVICLNASDGSVKWHRRLPWLINNSLLKICRITDSPGANLALTVGQTERRTDSSAYARVNWLPDPSLAILDSEGEVEVFIEAYDEDNSDGHMTWCEDIDGDGLHEVCVCGHERAIWFDGTGERLFEMPSEGEGGHPDDLIVHNWLPECPGREVLYLNGTIGVRMFGTAAGRMPDPRRFELLAEVDLSEHSSHLQQIMALPQPEGPKLVLANIRDPHALLLLLDGNFQPQWGLDLPIDIMHPHHADVTGDGRQEIICGGRDREKTAGWCSLQVMTDRGEALYQHRWDDGEICWVLDVADIDGDGRPEILCSVGSNRGPQGRWSLPEGAEQSLYIIKPNAE
ncbi:MAG: hypothetical protein R6V07_09080 [Armatimonadota bacterium]